MQLVTRVQWGELGLLSSGDANFTLPFASFVREASLFVPRDGHSALRVSVVGLVVVSTAAAVLALVARRRASPGASAAPVPDLVPIGVALGVLLFVSLARVPFVNYMNVARAVTELLLLVLLVGWLVRNRAGDVTLAVLAGGGVVLAGWAVWATTPI